MVKATTTANGVLTEAQTAEVCGIDAQQQAPNQSTSTTGAPSDTYGVTLTSNGQLFEVNETDRGNSQLQFFKISNSGEGLAFNIDEHSSEENSDSRRSIFVKAHQKIPLSQSHQNGSKHIYIAARMSTVAWANFEALTRGIWHILSVILKMEAKEISFSQGLLIGDDFFCPAARFEPEQQHLVMIIDPEVQLRIEHSTALLRDPNLWNTQNIDSTVMSSVGEKLLDEIRRIRSTIGIKELPFACTMESQSWPQPINIPRNLALQKPHEKTTQMQTQYGVASGYCKDRRLMHFRKTNGKSIIDISFDEEVFLDTVIDASRKNASVFRVEWENELQDQIVVSRKLKKLETANSSLLEKIDEENG